MHHFMHHNKHGVGSDSPVVVGLDIGTTKIAVIAGRKMPSGKIQILGFGRTESSGVEMALVRNIQETRMAILTALEQCKQNVYKRFNTTLEIKDVCVGVAGHHIDTIAGSGVLIRKHNEAHKEFVDADVRNLIEQQYSNKIGAGRTVLHVLPKYFLVDGRKTLQPVGWNGHKLEGFFHIVTVDTERLNNIKQAVEGAGLSVQSLYLQPLASASATMSKEAIESGVMVMDIGGGTTDIAVYQNGVLLFTKSLPLGGKLITSHIKEYFQILEDQAEKVKKELGSALAEMTNSSYYACIPSINGLPKKEISVHSLARIIQTDMEKLVLYVNKFCEEANVQKSSLVGGVILTGGGSQLKYIQEFIALKMVMNARSTSHMDSFEPDFAVELKNVSYSTCIGLLILGFQEYEERFKVEQEDILLQGKLLVSQTNAKSAQLNNSVNQPSQQRGSNSLVYDRREYKRADGHDFVANSDRRFDGPMDYSLGNKGHSSDDGQMGGASVMPGEVGEQYEKKNTEDREKSGGFFSNFASKIKGSYDSFLDNMFGDFKDENIH